MSSTPITALACRPGGYWAISSRTFAMLSAVKANDSTFGTSNGSAVIIAILKRLLAVDLAEHDVERTDVRRHVGELVSSGHHVERLQVRETRRSDLAAIGFVGAVRDQVDAELALGRLDRSVGLAGRHLVALGVELEVMDQGLHRVLHLAAARRR